MKTESTVMAKEYLRATFCCCNSHLPHSDDFS